MSIVLAAFLLGALASPAAARELPVLTEGGPPVAGPAYRGDALLLHLRPAAARAALAREAPALPGGAASALRTTLGLAGLDAAAARAGGARFESMFAPAPNATVSRESQGLAGFYRVHLTPGASLEQAIAAFAAAPDVESAEPIAVVPVSGLMPNDSLFSISTWFYQPSRRDIHAPEAWALGTGDTSVVIGILDTGVIPYHPDLGGTIAGLTGNLWVNWAERAGVPGVDDDGNGKVDDVAGWDFVASATNGPFPAGEDIVDEDSDPNDFAGHGTLVAGCAGALTDNTIGVAGAAPTVRLMPLRVGWSSNIAPLGLVDLSYAAEAIVYGVENGAAVLNCSFSTLPSSALAAAEVAAARAGVFVVFAAGNGGQPNDESRREDLVTVAATTDLDQVAGFSNLGTFVDVAAPGEAIVSTALAHVTADSIGMRQPTYGSSSGTSFATPIVSGAIALWESRRRALGEPRLDPTNLALRLWDTADNIATLNPGITGYGGGRLNVENLLLAPAVSRAYRAGARSTGPTVIVPERSGPQLAWVATNRALVIQRANAGDTLALATLPGILGRQLAAADLGGGHGVALFAGTANGRMCGYDLHGVPLPGWPYVAASGFTQFLAGPALGDLDGDGVLEVACGSVDGNLWAWDAGGNVLPDFPVATSASGIAGAIALADVDGAPGDEIIAASKDGKLHAVRFDGTEAPGFPATIAAPAPTVSPVIGTLSGSPAIVVAGGTQAHAFGFDGALRWNAAIGGTVAFDPALADLDGDGSDEILFATGSPNGVAALKGTGASFTERGWPAALPAAPGGAPVVGPLAPGQPRATLLLVGTSIAAITDSARLIPGFAKPGGAGIACALADVDGDGRTEVAAGTGPDSLVYLYDAGAASAAPVVSWPAFRGDDARRGNRVAPLMLPVVDLTPPATIADLAVDSLGPGGARVTWSAPGGDGAIGRAASFQLNVTTIAKEAGLFHDGAVRSDAPAPAPAGTPQSYRLGGLAPGASVFVAVRAIDSTGNVAPASNVVHVVTPLGPLAHAPAQPLAPLDQPSVHAVKWSWRLGAGASASVREIRLYDLQGRWLTTLPLPAGEAGVEEWNGRDHSGRAVPAGIIFARLLSGSFQAQSRVVLLP